MWGPQNKGTKEIKLKKGGKRGPLVLTKPELDKNAWGESRRRNIRGAAGSTTGPGEQEKLPRGEGSSLGRWARRGSGRQPPECEGWGSALSLGDQRIPGLTCRLLAEPQCSRDKTGHGCLWF